MGYAFASYPLMQLRPKRILSAISALWLFVGWGTMLLAATATPPPFSVSFDIAAVPPWVKTIVPEPAPRDDDSGGISYLVSDQQENVEPRAAYYHEARQITSENGVQNGSSITVSFDPSYQRLVFHFIRVARDRVTTDRLERSQIKLLQREKDMEEFLFDGTYTANCQLEDVRVGDVIEFAYTVEGANPVKKGKYSSTFPTDWTFPVRHALARVVYPSKRKLEFRSINRAIRPAITSERGVTEWLLEESNVPGRKADPETPPGYDPCGWVQISEWASWEEVIDWAIPLYQIDTPPSPELAAEINKLKEISDPEQCVLAALRFVQNEIRYLGIESGVNSHQPTAPSEVLRRRFGDCKDKVTLLFALLHRVGIDASPALVSNDHRSAVAERLPSPGIFDHVIVQVRLGQETYWLDATRSGQRGPLSQIYVGNFGYALVLRHGHKALTSFAPPPGSLAKKKVLENYRIPAPGGSAKLEVISNYWGRWAEDTRSRFQEKGREKIQKDYLQYYARRFPGIRPTQTLQYEELSGENSCQTKEFYLIPNIWQLNEDKSRYEVALYPGEVDHDMGSPGSSQRDDPLALDHPIDTTQEINAEMFADWSVETKNKEIANAFYRFRDTSKIKGRHLQFNYSYESLTDRVSPADLPAYNTALAKLKDTLGYTLYYSAPVQWPAIGKWLGQVNWWIIVLLAWVLTIATAVSIWFVWRSKLPVPLPPAPPILPCLEGIGGWLILVAIHHVLRPITFIAGLVVLVPTVFNLEAWRLLTQSGQTAYDPHWAPMLLFELFYNALCLLFSSFLLILFFKKRAVWRRCYVVFLIVFVLGVGLDAYFAQQISAGGGSFSGVKDLAQVIGAATIWIPYCLVSKRVKATFRY